MDRLLRNNNFLRILAILLACILWLAVKAPDQDTSANSTNPANAGTSIDSVTEKYPLPIHIQAGNDVIVSSINPPTAVLQVKSNMINVMSLPSQMLHVQLVANAEGLGAGSQQLNIAALGVPKDVTSYSVVPQTVTVVLSNKITVSKPVKFIPVGNVSAGYSLGQIGSDITSVDVSGAESAVSSVQNIEAQVPVDGASRQFAKVVNLVPIDAHGNAVKNVEISPSAITVDVPVKAASETTALKPEATGTPASGYVVKSITLSSSKATIFGQPKASLPNGLVVPVDVSGLTKSTTKTVPVPMVNGMTSVDPGEVTATITLEPVTDKTVTVPVNVVNVGSGLSAKVEGTGTVSIVVRGPQSILNSIQTSDIQATANAAGLGAGPHTLPFTTHVPDSVSLVSANPSAVTVNLSNTK